MGEMNGKKAKVQRTNQGCCGNAATERDSGVRPSGLNAQSVESLGTHSPNRSGGNWAERCVGGILTQLIEDAEDQLEESESVIERERKRIAKLNKRLEKLKQVQAMQEKANN